MISFEFRLYDIRTRMAQRFTQPRFVELYVSVSLISVACARKNGS